MNTRRFIFTVTIFLAALLEGCAGQPLVESVVTSEAACCKNVKDFLFRPLPAGQEMDFKITELEPTSTLNGKLQHFASFSVADSFRPSALIVKSYLSSGYLPKATAVNPQFIFFDKSFAIIQQATLIDVHDAHGFWRSGFIGRVIVPLETKYIVVIAGPNGPQQTVVYSGNGTPHFIPAAAYGELSVSLYGEPTN